VPACCAGEATGRARVRKRTGVRGQDRGPRGWAQAGRSPALGRCRELANAGVPSGPVPTIARSGH
jgi:hypothetical protein